MTDDKAEVLRQVAILLHNKNFVLAEKMVNEKYPFTPIESSGRNYTVKQMVTQFFNDGFIDRYSGKRLVNPGILRIMSEMLPEAFPYQAHWKTDECHMAYWDLQPTVDHIYPVSLGGKDTSENWATTSMVNNSIKNNFTLEQLGWNSLVGHSRIKEIFKIGMAYQKYFLKSLSKINHCSALAE